jgi:hypothetical protein
MKIKCIDNKDGELYLTIDKTYNVIEDNKFNYKIINDNGYNNWYYKEYFKPLSEYRNERIDKLLEDES